MSKEQGQEFFYVEGGKRADADFHEPIIASGEVRLGLRPPMVDEAKLGAIREKLKGKAKANRHRHFARH